jgi:uncharacterized protein YjiS (DUF1127 family)
MTRPMIVTNRCGAERDELGLVDRVFATMVTRAADRILSWMERARQRRRLDSLSDHMLKDMGLSRFDTDQEAGKRFWRG